MCLIIYKPAGTEIPNALIERAEKNNNDGWGLMWTVDGRMETTKGFGIKGILEAIEDETFKANNGFVHFRLGTSGAKDLENCHPFRVTDDIYMMHNGIFRIENNLDATKSDTWHFVEKYLRPLLKEDPTAFLDKDWLSDLAWFVGTNKIAILNAAGESGIVNAGQWSKYKGLLLSNLNSCNTYSSPSGSITKNGYHDAEFDDDFEWGHYCQRSTTQYPALGEGKIPQPTTVENVGQETEKLVTLETLDKLITDQLRKEGVTEITEEFITDAENSYYADNYDGEMRMPVTLGDILSMHKEDIQEFVEEFPEAAAAMLWRADWDESYSEADEAPTTTGNKGLVEVVH